MKKNRSNSTRSTALGGVLLALTIAVLYVESIAPTARLSLYAVSSFFVSIMVIESGIHTGWIFYIASSLLALIIVPDKIGLLPYFLFFGVYGIVKYYVEKINKLIIEYILKYLIFNTCLVIIAVMIKEVFIGDIVVYLDLWVLLIVLQIIFFIYDYVYTGFIQYYNKRIRGRLGFD